MKSCFYSIHRRRHSVSSVRLTSVSTHHTRHHGSSHLPPLQTNLHHPHILPRLLPLPLRSRSSQPLPPPQRCRLLYPELPETTAIVVSHPTHQFIFMDHQKLHPISSLLPTCPYPPLHTRLGLLPLQQTALSQGFVQTGHCR